MGGRRGGGVYVLKSFCLARVSYYNWECMLCVVISRYSTAYGVPFFGALCPAMVRYYRVLIISPCCVCMYVRRALQLDRALHVEVYHEVAAGYL